jgi:hypothetical protein
MGDLFDDVRNIPRTKPFLISSSPTIAAANGAMNSHAEAGIGAVPNTRFPIAV